MTLSVQFEGGAFTKMGIVDPETLIVEGSVAQFIALTRRRYEPLE